MHTFIIAEIGINHNGNLKTAAKMIQAACDAGADAVKFQTYRAEKLFGLDGDALACAKQAELTHSNHVALMACCDILGIKFISTPFDYESIELLYNLGLDIVKVSSLFATNEKFLSKLTDFPQAIVSTGMCDLNDIRNILEILPNATLLHCTSSYPTPMEDVNLEAMITLQELAHTGLSDHTRGIEVSIAAAALGAEVIEKHFTLDKNMAGPDHAMSLEPDELTQMIKSIRNVEKAMGDGIKRPMPSEVKVMKRKESIWTK